MNNVVRSELVRLARPKLLAGWYGLVTLFSLLIAQVMFSTVSAGPAPAAGPAAAFPDLAALQSAKGGLLALSAGASLFGVVTLSFWAVATATDYSTGLIRLLASAEPRRWRLLAGKGIALALVTTGAATIATLAVAAASPALAAAANVETGAWDTSLGALVAGWGNTVAAMLVWGVLGLVVAVIARSSGAAIAVGVGYVLVFETVVQQVVGQGTTWLLGTVLSALAAGGNATLSYGGAAAIALAYSAVGLIVATVVTTTRDVND
jgi:ABC-2 type transport system permease protein